MKSYISMHEIVLLNCPEIGMHVAFMYACIEACHAFKRMGYTVRIARSISDLSDNCIVFMGNDIHVPNPVTALSRQAPRAVYIGWYWNEQDVTQLPHFVHTHENKLKPKLSLTYVGSNAVIRVPFLLRANYHGTKNHIQFLNYETRKRIYLSSMFALGFQSKVNADEKHVSQRIYEGLAYGCIVLSNSEAARDQTDGIVEFVSSRREIEAKIDYYLNNPEAYLAKQIAGYNFIKTRDGTNHATAQLFIEAINVAFPGIL